MYDTHLDILMSKARERLTPDGWLVSTPVLAELLR